MAETISSFGHERSVLVLQGGGALGAYQAGVYEGMAEAGIAPDWISGVSIGAVNGALIAGNPPERRTERLREFWERVSSIAPLIPPDALSAMRPLLRRANAMTAAIFGVPGFFWPRLSPTLFADDGSLGALSVYDTGPLKDTLEELIDFDLLNSGSVRLSLGAVNIRLGNSVYFDNQQMRLTPDHVRASGSLPPGFPPVIIDGEHYWDGGIVSNTPLWYVLDDSPRMNALIVQVDLFSAEGPLPQTLDQVMEREKDIRFSSKTRFNTKRVKELSELRASLRRVLPKLPPELIDDPDVKRLNEACKIGNVTITHLINRRQSFSAQSKDYEFSRATVHELWATGLGDMRRAVANKHEWMKPNEVWEGMRTYDATR